MLFGAILTIFISCIGLFGLSVLSAEKRTKEIGIRKVLGASVSSVVTILSKDFLKLVIIALLDMQYHLHGLAANKWLAKLSISHYIKLVDVCRCRFIGNIYCIGNSKLPGNKSSDCKPGEIVRTE